MSCRSTAEVVALIQSDCHLISNSCWRASQLAIRISSVRYRILPFRWQVWILQLLRLLVLFMFAATLFITLVLLYLWHGSLLSGSWKDRSLWLLDVDQVLCGLSLLSSVWLPIKRVGVTSCAIIKTATCPSHEHAFSSYSDLVLSFILIFNTLLVVLHCVEVKLSCRLPNEWSSMTLWRTLILRVREAFTFLWLVPRGDISIGWTQNQAPVSNKHLLWFHLWRKQAFRICQSSWWTF